MKTIRVLAIDGGGIRGIIPAMILTHVEQLLRYYSGNENAHNVFLKMRGPSVSYKSKTSLALYFERVEPLKSGQRYKLVKIPPVLIPAIKSK